MTEQATAPTAPEASKAVVESFIRKAFTYAAERREKHGSSRGEQRVLLIRAAPQWRGDSDIVVTTEEGPVPAQIRGCPTVLSVLDALSEPRDERTYLLVLTPCEDRELGNTVLAQALRQQVHPIRRWDLVLDTFGARKLDPRLTSPEFQWLAEALLDAQPGTGWRPVNGPVLQAATVLQRLASLRVGRDGSEDDLLDAAALLDWSRDETRVARFLGLRQEEQDGLARWLGESAGPVAEIVFRLLRAGQVSDAVPFGLVVAELYAPADGNRQDVMMARGRAEQRFLGGHAPGHAGLRAYAEAAESLTLRWSENGHPADAQAMCDRAEQILHELGAAVLAADSKVLDAGLDARIAAFADKVATVLPAPRAVDLDAVEHTLTQVLEHRRWGTRMVEVEATVAAARLVRWLAAEEAPPATVADGARRCVRSWAWVDRALATIFDPDTARTPRAQAAYAALFGAARERRAALDQAFAERLATWSPVAGPTGDLLLAENVLERIARPVAERGAPLIIVVDGMSAAVACALAEEIIATREWAETGRDPNGREGAIAAFPSATTFCRTSLLCGELKRGTQPEERSGFAAFWRGRKAVLFHKAGLRAGAGAVLNEEVRAAISERGTVVGVVLNTIDDALRDGREGSAPTWRVGDVTFLQELLTAAAGAGRPVVLTSDHGHVLDHADGVHPVAAESARHRQGQPSAGEVIISGPRVLTPGGAAVLPWDERIRYGPRKAGYHGGASLAEMTIPVLVFVPSSSPIPSGWTCYDNPSLHEPAWWNTGATLPRSPAPSPASAAKRQPKKQTQQDNALFGAEDIPRRDTLGTRVVRSEAYATQRAYVRKPPDDVAVAAVIDGIATVGGKLPIATVADLAGQPPFRMAGYLAQLGRLLNVEGYPVIGDADGGRTVDLNVRLLTEQFLGGSG